MTAHSVNTAPQALQDQLKIWPCGSFKIAPAAFAFACILESSMSGPINPANQGPSLTLLGTLYVRVELSQEHATWFLL